MSSVDVIVPCYRYGQFLRECVKSVVTQSVQNVRVLIIDDASPDNTAEVAVDLVREDSRVTFLRHTTNKGHIDTYNEGIGWASSDYMLILSADDYLLPDALGRSTDLMDAHPEVGFTFGKAIELNDTGAATQTENLVNADHKPSWRILGGLEFIELTAQRNIVRTPTAVVRTELQKHLGGYRPELPHAGDMEMWLRFAAHSSVGIVEGYQAVYRRHCDNMSVAYKANGWLPDLEQRKAALDCFFQSSSSVLPNPQQLRARLFFLLACDAVGFASTAFNQGEMKISQQLSEFALGVCPQTRRSLAWAKLVCKRCLGSRAWSALRPAVAKIRQTALL